jgi:hypothetical protein
VFADESGICLTPPVRRTWAPRGRTPTIRAPTHRTWISLLACICYRPDRGRVRLASYARRGTWNTTALIEVLPRLRGFLHGEPAVLIWDRLAAHHSDDMLCFLATQRDWLRVEQLPSYAPELDPVEMLLSQCERCRSRCASGSASSFAWRVGWVDWVG